jgi:hypothetical protein
VQRAQIPGIGDGDAEIAGEQCDADLPQRVLGPVQPFEQGQGGQQQCKAQQVLEQVLLECRQRVAGAPKQDDGQRPDQRAAQREELAPADQCGESTTLADRILTGTSGTFSASSGSW